VLRVVRNLAGFNGVVIGLLVAYAWFLRMPFDEIIPLVLTAVLASIPVALPATFTLAAALGARALAKLGVLPTRLTAVDEAASINVLCADKTGTLTRNALTVTTVRPMPGFDEAHVLALAALASSDGGQDPVDGAIRLAAASKAVADAPQLIKFAAFDPAKKMSEATATESTGGHATDREGRLRRRHQPRSAVAHVGCGGERTRSKGFQSASGRSRKRDGDEACGTRRAQRPASP
jgi:H+-transporting ATPase